MKKILLVVWAILICCVFVHYFHTPEKPEVTAGEVKIDLEEQQLDLTNFWEALVYEQGFSNESAMLIQLNQFIDKDGAVLCTQAYYAGDVNGEQHLYEAYAHINGNVLYKDQVLEFPLQGAHPLIIFREINLINFTDLTQGKCNIALKTFKHENERRYNRTHGDLYVLSEGSLCSLKEVAFPHGTCWYTIEITPGVLQSERDATTGSASGRLILFTEQSINLADTVIYECD